MKFVLFGFCGKAGCGKGTVSKIIKDNYKGSVGIFPLAEELKRLAREEFGWDGKKDEKGRRLLQVLGTECGRMYGGESFWVDKWERKVYKWLEPRLNEPFFPIVICDDVRFDNEAKRIKDLGGHICHIVGRAYDMGDNNNHASEKGISPELINSILVNDMSMEDLEIDVKIAFHL